MSASGSEGTRTNERFATREVTILLADLRGFSSISESYPTEVVIELLNRYLTRMSEIIIGHHGAIHKFMGDSIMALFSPERARDHVKLAVACAVEMQLAMDQLNRSSGDAQIPELHMGIGINTGKVMAGMIGSELYSEYAVIGDEVNLASRIEAFSLRGQILASESTYELCRNFVKTNELRDVHVKGKAHPVSLREILGVPSLGIEVPRREVRRSARVDVRIPFMYHMVRNKIVMPEPRGGTILDISYHGVQAELAEASEPHAEIKFDLDLPLADDRATDIYGRLLRVRPGPGGCTASIEFTSIGVRSAANIRRFVQLLVQGSEAR
jgi:adenylate cyclase